MSASLRPPNSARTAVFQKPGSPHAWIDVPLPREAELRPGERLVALRCATICGSDLHTIAGRRQEPTPCVLGHEGVGVVVRAAPDQRAWLGRRVTWTSSVGCGQASCAPCAEHDMPQKCSTVFKYGHVARDDQGALAGTYATHLLLRAGTAAFELPDVIPDTAAAPLNCALAPLGRVLLGLGDGVEHAELVADRIERYANVVGRERVIAGGDCGFGTQASAEPEVHPTIVWAKFEAMGEGAKIATERLWG